MLVQWQGDIDVCMHDGSPFREPIASSIPEVLLFSDALNDAKVHVATLIQSLHVIQD
jgi:hypothetical protein